MKYSPQTNKKLLSINYDKRKTTLKEILADIKNNKIEFNEINTHEGDLEDVFIELTKEKN